MIYSLEDNETEEVLALAKEQLGKDGPLGPGYVWKDGGELKGYSLEGAWDGRTVTIDWIYAEPGYGTAFLKAMEEMLFYTADQILCCARGNKIRLNVSIDPTEDKDTVMRRVNFYIKNNYRVYDIEWRPDHGPLFRMEKNKG